MNPRRLVKEITFENMSESLFSIIFAFFVLYLVLQVLKIPATLIHVAGTTFPAAVPPCFLSRERQLDYSFVSSRLPGGHHCEGFILIPGKLEVNSFVEKYHTKPGVSAVVENSSPRDKTLRA
jgi:hypothetical protein